MEACDAVLGSVFFSSLAGRAVLNTVKKVTYHISLKRLILRKLVMGIADGIMKADGNPIYEIKDMKVGLFITVKE